MASMTTMTASFLAIPNNTSRPGGAPVMVRAFSSKNVSSSEAAGKDDEKMMVAVKNSNGRREMVVGVAAAAVAALSMAKMAMAEEGEPKKGSPEAKKKYAPICVTMPTAAICRK